VIDPRACLEFIGSPVPSFPSIGVKVPPRNPSASRASRDSHTIRTRPAGGIAKKDNGWDAGRSEAVNCRFVGEFGRSLAVLPTDDLDVWVRAVTRLKYG